MTENTENVVGVSPFRIQRHPVDGSVWVPIDDLIDFLAQLGSQLDGADAEAIQQLSAILAPLASTELKPLHNPDGTGNRPVMAGPCPTCAAPVIVLPDTFDGELITADAEPTADGPLFAMQRQDGSLALAPWSPQLDGIDVTRMTVHTCPK